MNQTCGMLEKSARGLRLGLKGGAASSNSGSAPALLKVQRRSCSFVRESVDGDKGTGRTVNNVNGLEIPIYTPGIESLSDI